MSEFKDAPQAIQEVIGMAMPILLSERGFSRTEKEDLVYKVVLGSLAVMKYAEMLEMLEKTVEIIDKIHPEIKPIALLALRMNANELIKSCTEL